MSTRLLFCLALLGCGGNKPKETTPEPPPPAPAAPAEAPPAEPVAPAAPAAPKRLEPPQRWEQHGKRGEETVVMGFVSWTGGEAYEVQLMGTMRMIIDQKIKDAITAKPDDPGGAIQGVFDEMNAFFKESSVSMEWVRK